MQIGIHSEFGHLQKVIVHTPGREVSLVDPEIREELLFDDIIFEEDARIEHLNMLKIFSVAMPDDGEILEITDLISEVFSDSEAKDFFIDRLITEHPEKNFHLIKKSLNDLSAEDLLRFMVEGKMTPAIDINFSLWPLPNLLFTRDLAAVAGRCIIQSRAAKKARLRESVLMEAVLKYHPVFESSREHIIQIGNNQTIEGGDVLVVSSELVLIGMSERTSFTGLVAITEELLKHGVKYVVAVDIPKKRSSMHLDTIFTFCSKDECVVYPPVIENQTGNIVVLGKAGDQIVVEKRTSLKETLEELSGHSYTFIRCGGEDLTDQYREQWTDGANVFALAPGVIVGYERNAKTFESLERHGYEIFDQFEFIEEYTNKAFKPRSGKKMAIKFQGHELCRGRGGARCMTLPLLRKLLNH